MVQTELIENNELKNIAENIVRLKDAVRCVKEYEKLLLKEK